MNTFFSTVLGAFTNIHLPRRWRRKSCGGGESGRRASPNGERPCRDDATQGGEGSLEVCPSVVENVAELETKEREKSCSTSASASTSSSVALLPPPPPPSTPHSSLRTVVSQVGRSSPDSSSIRETGQADAAKPEVGEVDQAQLVQVLESIGFRSIHETDQADIAKPEEVREADQDQTAEAWAELAGFRWDSTFNCPVEEACRDAEPMMVCKVTRPVPAWLEDDWMTVEEFA